MVEVTAYFIFVCPVCVGKKYNALCRAHVSAPRRNGLQSTRVTSFVSMHCVGLTSLHNVRSFRRTPNAYRCQCPVSGSCLCTRTLLLRRRWQRLLCQCPVSGSCLCTRTLLLRRRWQRLLCQCPVSGSCLCTRQGLIIDII